MIKLSRFRTDLAHSIARHGRALLDSKQIAQEVAALEPLEAYFVIKELGAEAALPILRHVSREQLQTCIDLDCWEADNLLVEDLEAWLATFAADGPEALAAAFFNLDHEVQILLLQRTLCIFEARDDGEEPTDDRLPRMTTPDTYFVLQPRDDSERDLHPFALVDALYRADFNEAFRLLTAALWELSSSLEEQAHQFRSGRLHDLGFVPPDEAMSLFAAPPPSPRCATRWRDAGRGDDRQAIATRLPAVYAESLPEGCLLHRALAAVGDPNRLAALEQELVWLVNAAIIAYGEAPRDLAHVIQIAERVRDTTSLGLEALLAEEHPRIAARVAAHDPFDNNTRDNNDNDDNNNNDVTTAAAQIVENWPLRDLFRHGHAKVRALQAGCRKLAKSHPGLHQWLEQPASEHNDEDYTASDRRFIEALLAARPLLGGFDAARPARVRAFATLAELAAAEARLRRIAREHEHDHEHDHDHDHHDM